MAGYVEDDDDDEIYAGLFENGHWDWNDGKGCLEFFSDIISRVDSDTVHIPVVIGPIEFRDDLDVLEQQKFRKIFQRKIAIDDVVTLQDVIDYVLFTAPKAIITSTLVNVLHLPTTERFLRALICYCQYFLQISEEMSRRTIELHSKIRTARSDVVEKDFRDNLEDMRLLVAKEYCSMMIGAGDFAKYHHMGALKKTRSSTKKERILFESFLRISTQIVWLALGRRLYNQIELEIHRMCKSDIYNIIAHKKDSHQVELDEREEFVLFGHCVQPAHMMTARSPMMNEVNCDKDFDFHLMGLGVIHYEHLSPRLRYFEMMLIAPEDTLQARGVPMGILGLPRNHFDTTLKEVKLSDSAPSSTGKVTSSQSKNTRRQSKDSRASASSRKSSQVPGLLYEDIFLPHKDAITYEESLPDDFPNDSMRRLSTRSICEAQRKKWLIYAVHLRKFNMHRRKKPK